VERQDCSQTGEGEILAQNTARELFQIGALLLGNEAEAADLVEETVAGVQADPCADAEAAHDEARERLIRTGLERMQRIDPSAFKVENGVHSGSSDCLGNDDDFATALSLDRMTELTRGSGRAQLRQWLEQLPLALRAVFVLRAVVGLDSAKTAESLRNLGDRGWTSDGTSRAFREALCSLASSLAHSPAPQLSA
jgi:DNA-directed RNA polymerase specialized sigma24 family protein